jgi:hypothetical protein
VVLHSTLPGLPRVTETVFAPVSSFLVCASEGVWAEAVSDTIARHSGKATKIAARITLLERDVVKTFTTTSDHTWFGGSL